MRASAGVCAICDHRLFHFWVPLMSFLYVFFFVFFFFGLSQSAPCSLQTIAACWPDLAGPQLGPVLLLLLFVRLDTFLFLPNVLSDVRSSMSKNREAG